MMTDDELDATIDADRVFRERLILTRARASELTAILRGLTNSEPAIMATPHREQSLRLIEFNLAEARSWVDSLQRSVLIDGPRV